MKVVELMVVDFVESTGVDFDCNSAADIAVEDSKLVGFAGNFVVVEGDILPEVDCIPATRVVDKIWL